MLLLRTMDNITRSLSNHLGAQNQSLSLFKPTMMPMSVSSQLPSHSRRSTRSSLADGATLGAWSARVIKARTRFLLQRHRLFPEMKIENSGLQLRMAWSNLDEETLLDRKLFCLGKIQTPMKSCMLELWQVGELKETGMFAWTQIQVVDLSLTKERTLERLEVEKSKCGNLITHKQSFHLGMFRGVRCILLDGRPSNLVDEVMNHKDF